MNGGEQHKKNAQARNPPKAKMKALPRTPWTIKKQDPSRLHSLQAAGLPCHAASLLLVPRKHISHAVNHCEWGYFSKKLYISAYM